MRTHLDPLRLRKFTSRTACFLANGCCLALLSGVSLASLAQTPAPPPANPNTPAPAASTPANSPVSAGDADSSVSATSKPKDPLISAGAFSVQTKGGEVDEDQLKQLLAGKTLYLRDGYQDNNLEFDEWGRLTGHSAKASFTLSQIQINKVKLSKHKLELQGDRYALHFLGAAPYEDPTKATDRVKITPKKKTVRISFDREQVEKPKKEKHKRKHKGDDPAGDKDSDESNVQVATSAPQPDNPADFEHPSGDKTTKTLDPAHASQLLITALDKVFAPGIDDRMIAAMPAFWKLYFQAAAQKSDYRPSNPGVYFQNTVDQKAKLISALDPPSNEFAQANGVAGMALYHAVVGSDGKVEQVVAGRPIGFGLDENAEQTIRKATFQPAMKDGKPVPVALDLVVSFRIYSKRTSQPATNAQEAQESNDKPALPGPYTLEAIEQAQAAQQGQAAQQNQTAPQAQPPETPKAPQ